MAIQQNIVSYNNSSIIALAANATFTGAFENVLQYQEISCFCVSDVSGTLYLDLSVDGINVLASFPFVSTGSIFFRAPSNEPFARIRYINGVTLQTQFSLTTIYRPVAGMVAQLPIASSFFDASLASNTRTIVFGKNSNSVYTAVGTDLNDGGLDVHVTNFPIPIGTQGNAWNAASVSSGGNSNVIDCQFLNIISIFGNVSNNVNPLRIQASQDNTNFYTVTTISATTGNFGSTISWGARYMRLQSGQGGAAVTITATIAGK